MLFARLLASFALVLCLTAGCRHQASSVSLASAPASATSTTSAATASLESQASWPGGYCANIVVKNSGSASSSSWSFVVKANGARISKWWNVNTVVQANTGDITVTPAAAWNARIAPGATSKDQGFCADLPSGAQPASIQAAAGPQTAPSPSAPPASPSPAAPTGASTSYPTCTNGSDTGNGFGWDPGVTGPGGSHSCVVAKTDSAAVRSAADKIPPASDSALAAVDFQAAGNVYFQLHDYGQQLQANKQALAAACAAAGATATQKAVIIAIAMQETTLMAAWQRDQAKDWSVSANSSLLNLNYDMLTKLGYGRNDYGAYLNDPSHLGEAVGYMLKAFKTWGIQATLNYHRGGYTALLDGYSYGAYNYRNAIGTMYKQMQADQALLEDGRRIEINVQHM